MLGGAWPPRSRSSSRTTLSDCATVIAVRCITYAAGALAWLAIASSGMLMAIGYRGVDGEGRRRHLGADALRDAAARRVVRVRAARLGDTFVPADDRSAGDGARARRHGARRARRAGRGARVGDGRAARASSPRRRTTSRWRRCLHHLGQVTLDDPEVAGRRDRGCRGHGACCARSDRSPAAGDIVAGDSDDPRRRLAVQVLRIASEYDDLTVVDGTPPDVALETLRSAPRLRLRRAKVLSALERACARSSASARRHSKRCAAGVVAVGRGSAKSRGRSRGGSVALPFVCGDRAACASGSRGRSVAETDRDDQVAEAQHRVERLLSTMMSERNSSWSSDCLAGGASRSAATQAWLRQSGGIVTGMPWLSDDHEEVARDADEHDGHAAEQEVAAAEPENQHVRRDEQAESDVVPAHSGSVTHSSPSWSARPQQEQRAPAPVRSCQEPRVGAPVTRGSTRAIRHGDPEHQHPQEIVSEYGIRRRTTTDDPA